jgi:hypothetical protein
MSHGKYETRKGFVAIVARMTSRGTSEWIVRGAVKINNVLVLHNWTQSGVSTSGESDWDLIRRIEE